MYGYSIDDSSYSCLDKTKEEAINRFLKDNKDKIDQSKIVLIGEFNKISFTPKIKIESVLNDIQKEISSDSRLKTVRYFEDLTEEQKDKMEKSLSRSLKNWLSKNYYIPLFYSLTKTEPYLYKDGILSLVKIPKMKQ